MFQVGLRKQAALGPGLNIHNVPPRIGEPGRQETFARGVLVALMEGQRLSHKVPGHPWIGRFCSPLLTRLQHRVVRKQHLCLKVTVFFQLTSQHVLYSRLLRHRQIRRRKEGWEKIRGLSEGAVKA